MYIYKEMINIVFEKFPEIKERYADNIKWWETASVDGQLTTYQVYEDYFNRIIEDALKNEPDKSELLDRIFNFFEEMATSKDGDVTNLLQVALLESIWSIGYPAYKRAEKLMLPETRKLSEALEEYLERPTP